MNIHNLEEYKLYFKKMEGEPRTPSNCQGDLIAEART